MEKNGYSLKKGASNLPLSDVMGSVWTVPHRLRFQHLVPAHVAIWKAVGALEMVSDWRKCISGGGVLSSTHLWV